MAHYISKDFVHYGCGLILEPDKVWELIPYSVQKNIKKAIRNHVRIEKVIGSKEDIEVLKSMWYDYDDPNMPYQLSVDDYMFIAYNGMNEPIGAVILLPVGNHLFLNNLAGNAKGKALGIQDYLLWHTVNFFKDSRFKYIDVGVSYRQMLYNFFKKWQTISYPVIFNKPESVIKISDKPFVPQLYTIPSDNEELSTTLLKEIFDTPKITFVPNIQFAETILTLLEYEVINSTFDYKNAKKNKPYIIDLTRLFTVQFGAIIVNLEINDTDMWNKFHCLDVYKRKFVLNAIYNEINNLSVSIENRKRNYLQFENYFLIEDILPILNEQFIYEYFYFSHNLNDKYHRKLVEFEIEHKYNQANSIIGLPVHQNLSYNHIEYIYAIFRGILNLCSEWEHTDNYKEIKI